MKTKTCFYKLCSKPFDGDGFSGKFCSQPCAIAQLQVADALWRENGSKQLMTQLIREKKIQLFRPLRKSEPGYQYSGDVDLTNYRTNVAKHLGPAMRPEFEHAA